MTTFGDLFAGIGGFSLGFERAGMECRWHVEIDPYCQKVLRKHWPHCGEWDDVRTFPPTPAEDWYVDVICGGFPCQDISNAGKRAVIYGERSGLWREMLRVVREIRPRIVVVENVAALLERGAGRVLGDLAESGYSTEWGVLSSAGVGANHIRERFFAVSNSDNRHIVYTSSVEFDGRIRSTENASPKRTHVFTRNQGEQEPGIPRVANGIPNQLDRCRSLGNSVDPRVTEWIGRRIMSAIKETE